MSNKVSIIIPCYNQARFLDECMQSVLAQTYDNWECIIVNDGSPDNTADVAKKWLEKDSRFNYIYKENGGLSSARNAGINRSTGEFILTLDADDKYKSTFIEKALRFIVSNETTGVVSSWGVRFIENKELDEFRPTGGSLEDFLYCNSAIGTSLFRKKCWEQSGGYDEKMKKGYEDWEFYIRVCKLGWNVHIIQEVLFCYRQHQSSMRIEALNKFDREIRFYIFMKHKELYCNYFDTTIDSLLLAIELNKKNEIKRIQSIDYRIGSAILKPFRYIKSLFK